MAAAAASAPRFPLAPLALAFACVGANGLSTIAADTLFVSAFSLGDLSRFLGIAAVVRVVASLAYAAVMDRLAADPRRGGAIDGAVVGLTAALLGGSAVLANSSSPAVIYAVCLAQLVLPPLLPLLAFNATASLLAARHAKRVLPLVGAAATLGSIAVSAASAYLAKAVGMYALFAAGAILCLPAIPILLRMGAQAEPETAGPPSAVQTGFVSTLRETAGDVAKVPAVRVVVALGLFGAMIANFVDFSFKAALKASYDREQMAAVLGTFGVVANTAVLAMQILLTGRLVARVGVGRSLMAGPVLVGAAGLASAALPPVAGSGVARLAEFVVRYGLGNSVADLILVPLARGIRTRAKIVVKGSATPIGGLVSAGVLAAFGETGPGRVAQVALVAGTSVLLVLALREAPRAYAAALAAALSRGRMGEDVSPEAAALFKAEVGRMLASHVQAGRFADAQRTLDLMSDRFFAPSDVVPALAASDPETRRAAVLAAARLTGSAEGDSLLALIPPDADPRIEAALLSAAREQGGLADSDRAARAVAILESGPADEATAALWSEGLLHQALEGRRRKDAGGGAPAQASVDQALKQLRKAAKGDDSPVRAAALQAIGTLGDRRAEREVLIAMGTRDPAVFQQAARAAVLLDASGAVSSLVARLVAGPHPAVAARSLALAGPRAVRELVQALPVTRGDGAVAPTAVAEGRTVSGTARAARALARIGEGAAREVLRLYGSLGHRARVAVAHAFGATTMTVPSSEKPLVESALGTLIGYGEAISVHAAAAPKGGLLSHELARRLSDTREAVLDLSGVLADKRTLARARLALAGEGRAKDDALELLEATLPQGLGRRFAVLCAEAAPPADRERSPLDGWLEKCEKLDRGELPLSDPMAGVLEKVLLLRDVPLFRGLSGEELYPVAEIATVEAVEQGATIVTQGEASDDLFVVAEGEVAVIKDGEQIGQLEAGKAFGELGVLDGAPRAATIRASRPSRLLRIPRVELEGLLDESPELAKGIIRTLLGYVRTGKQS